MFFACLKFIHPKILIRVCTRATILEFSLPPIGPVDEDEEEVFAELDSLILGGDVSSSPKNFGKRFLLLKIS